ncbi:MAG TPA: ABC transporter transmembrane domain-containing protein, partial [Xanthobacteraceae bacterium]
MLAGKIAAYRAFARQSLALLADGKTLFFFFVTLSVLAALSEGMSITLLVPILEAQGGQRGFANVPILGTVSDLFAPLSPARRIEAVAIAIGVVVVLRNLLQYVVDVLSAIIPLHLEQKLNLRSYAALMGVEIAYIHQSQYGSLLNGLGAWSQRVTMVLASIATILSNLMTVAVYGVLMLAMSWQLTAMAVAFLLLMSLMLRWLTSSVLQRTGRRLSEATSRVNQLLMETVTGMKLIRLTAAEPTMSAAYRRAVESAYASQRGASKAQALTAPLLTTCATLFICLLLFVNAAIHDGEPGAWIGSILLFLFLLFRLIGPINSINTARARMLKHMHAFDMLNAFYEQMEARRQPNGSRPAMSPR